MVTEGSVKRAPAASVGYEEFERDFEALLREQQHQSRAVHDREGELNLHRSGSAPPTVEGSRTAVGSLFRLPGLPESVRLDGHDAGEALSEEEMRSHPAYLSYYYSNENLNPRLPPPMVSKEDWKVAQRFHGLGGIGDRRRKTESWDGDASGSSLFSLQPGGLGRRGERELIEPAVQQKQSAEWLERGSDGLIGLSDVGLGMRRKSFADVIQEGLVCSTSVSGHLSRPASRNACDNLSDQTVISDHSLLHNGSQSVGGLHSGAYTPNLVRVKSLGSSLSHSFVSAVRSPGKTTTTGREPIRRLPSPGLPSMGRDLNKTDKKILEGSNGHVASNPAMLSAFSSLRLSEKFMPEGGNVAQGKLHAEYGEQPESLLNMPLGHKHYMQQKLINNSEDELLNSSTNSFPVYADFSEENGLLSDADLSEMPSNGQFNLQKQLVSGNLHKSVTNAGSFNSPGSSHYQAAEVQHNQGLPVMSNNQFDAGLALGGVMEGQYLSNVADNMGSNFQLPVSDPIYAQHAQGPSDYVTQAAARLDPSFGNNLLSNSYVEMPELQRAYLETLLAEQRLQYDMQFSNKSDELNHGFYSASTFGLGMPYQASPLSSSVFSSLGPVGPLRQSARLSHFPSLIRSSTGGCMGSWNMGYNLAEGFASSLLDEFKNNKSRDFELSDIMDHVVEFSMDQFGSRFIQQKLETASVEEKNMIFPKLLPQARSLMTDVFGNYVIQKCFEHGTEIQRKELANQLTGHVLPLSLQMYGCRVIQKALEVVDIDQQTQMVLELEGSIMKCVRDQNGNHVVQKCIECVPQERIQFIVETFYGQVVALSTHPYGCRVIQRVLEHCDDPETQSTMMEEILKSVCMLAQDQYGNYVIQHVLQHGKPEERSAIISKLTGQIVRMSQQKFASNVIEKCLTYGSPEERQLLINEMLGSTDENDPLQAMMKDQFANYVVQKVLETCDDRNRELILSRIKVHLNGLKKYTYGKHIVARVEKLIATGERRIGITSYSS